VTKRVVHNFYQTLDDGGYLFTGFSESLRYLSDEFNTVQVGGVFLYQKESVAQKTSPKARATKSRKSRSRPPKVQPSQQPRPVSSRNDGKLKKICFQAKQLLEAGQLAQAGDLLTSCLEQSTDPEEEVLLLQAEILLNQGDLEKAVQTCESLIRREPLSIAGHFLLGIVYRSMNDEHKATEEFKKVAYLDPGHALAQYYLGGLYAHAGKFDEAKRAYTNVVRLLRKDVSNLDVRFAGGFSPALLMDTCRSRIQTLNSQR
jgi:chemotaxis protein methyltransferase CheR